LNERNPSIDPIFIATFQFQLGKFDDAQESFLEIIKNNPNDFQSLVLLGNLALLKNKFTEAVTWLTKALEVAPSELAPHALLAEVYYRQDNYQKASLHLRQYGINDMAELLESFDVVQPFLVEGDKKSFKVKMLKIDPLPLVEVTINDNEPAVFLIDTGAADIVIDVDYAKENKLEFFGSKEGTFAGGKKAVTHLGKIDSFTIGDLKISNLTASYISVRPISQIFGGTQINGILGTGFFYHFITTMDYPQGEVIFQRNTIKQLEIFEHELRDLNPIEIPFWMAEDHFMVAWGQVNDGEPTLFFLDTGLAGGGFTGSKTTLEDGGVELDESKAFEGIGGGGMVKAIPFKVDKLSFGDAVEENINGAFIANFPLENKLGFRIGGIISHQFFRSYALTFDFIKMRFILVKKQAS